jgi:hypothetical protein
MALKTVADKIKIPGVHIANSPDLGLQAKADVENLHSPFMTCGIYSYNYYNWIFKKVRL